jgi:hypothetical protein
VRCNHFKSKGKWWEKLRAHDWYGDGTINETWFENSCERFYQTWYADGSEDTYVRCKLENNTAGKKVCVAEGFYSIGRQNVTKNYCPYVPRELKNASTDPDLNHTLAQHEIPSNFGKWGAWALDFLKTSRTNLCPSYSWWPRNLTNRNIDGCEKFWNITGVTGSSVVSYLSEEDQAVDVVDECGDKSMWTVTVEGAGNLGYETQRPIYGFDSGGGCAADLVTAQAAETWEWPLVRVRYNMIYDSIDSSTYEDDDSDGSTQYLLINSCYAYFSVHDSSVTPTQRSSTWPTFGLDGSLVASNPC